MTVCWKARAVLPKLEAQRLSEALEQIEPPPVVSAFELGERGLWEVEAFFAIEPDEAQLLQDFGVPMRVIPIQDENWVARALEGLPPVETGRFFIYGSHDASTTPQNKIGLHIEASYAFGTGHHGTTRGCLLALEYLIKRRSFNNALDLGCGTGVLGLAFARLLPKLFRGGQAFVGVEASLSSLDADTATTRHWQRDSTYDAAIRDFLGG
jgi:ribosomal protein L11 methyltransferase